MILWNKPQQLDFAARCQKLRRRQRWNTAEMARALDTTMSIVQRIEKGLGCQDALLLRFAALELALDDASTRRRTLRALPPQTETIMRNRI